jgi:hypothetical protein
MKPNTPQPGWQPPQDLHLIDTLIALVLFVAPPVYLAVWALWLR